MYSYEIYSEAAGKFVHVKFCTAAARTILAKDNARWGYVYGVHYQFTAV